MTERPLFQTGPQSLVELFALRQTFATWYYLVYGLAICLSIANRSLISRGIPSLARRPGDALLILILAFTGSSLAAALTYSYGGKVGIKNPLSVSLLNFIPIAQWVAFFVVVGYTPDYLKEEERALEPSRPFPYWIVPAIIPVGLFVLLALVRPEYIGLLFSHILGWAILAVTVVVVTLSMALVWIANARRWIRGGWTAILLLLDFVLFTLPAIWLILIGPAGIQLFRQFLQ